MPSLPNRDFSFFPIPNTPANPPPLALSTSSIWTYCGPLLPLSDDDTTDDSNPDNLPPTFHAWSARTLSPPSSTSPLLPRLTPFLRAAHAFLRQHGMHHYWLSVRASQPTPEFDAPRWHTDDHFFDPARSDDARGRWKLCATLQGPGTMFAVDARGARNPAHACPMVRCAACGRTSEVVREEVAVGLRGEAVVQPGNGEVAFFRVGGREGAVHSEPRIDGDRVFVNLVPGTEAELRHLMARWGMEFPRSWSFGVPMTLDAGGHGGEGDRGVGENGKRGSVAGSRAEGAVSAVV
ncbi:hypothetical protein C8A00DRAFT_14751 [Chaetomidium leptoderma]|uniref:Uncharacterized protein n=1 Tax=Chaetomidium leptoderma TaxID=669021 RepID=A0AAN6VM51_9PEZI|nr:hypothetical protein C8A00DRAFT_14751 [Chaetomidium leptoderma]